MSDSTKHVVATVSHQQMLHNFLAIFVFALIQQVKKRTPPVFGELGIRSWKPYLFPENRHSQGVCVQMNRSILMFFDEILTLKKWAKHPSVRCERPGGWAWPQRLIDVLLMWGFPKIVVPPNHPF